MVLPGGYSQDFNFKKKIKRTQVQSPQTILAAHFDSQSKLNSDSGKEKVFVKDGNAEQGKPFNMLDLTSGLLGT